MDSITSLFGGGESQGASIDPTQQPFLKDLYERGQQVSYGTGGQEFGRQFQAPTFGAFNNLAQGGSMIPGLQQNLQNFGNQQNQYLDQSVSTGLDQMAQNFQRNIMPSISQGAALAGTSGGSRQGIAESNAANDFNKESSNFINQMYSGNFQNQMGNQLNAYGQMQGLQGQRNQAMQGALTSAPNAANLGFQNQYGNVQNYGKTIGAPTVLGGSSVTNPSLFAPIKLN